MGVEFERLRYPVFSFPLKKQRSLHFELQKIGGLLVICSLRFCFSSVCLLVLFSLVAVGGLLDLGSP